jgi:hypothetical protein
MTAWKEIPGPEVDKTVELRPRKSEWKHLLWFLAASGVFLYLFLFVLPNVPVSLSRDDDQIYLLNATRMWAGQVMYRDFFHFIPPGTEMAYEALFALFGMRTWIPNLMLVVLGLATTWVTTHLARKVVPGTAALLPGLLYLVYAFTPSLPAAHHLFSVLAILIGVALLMEKRTTGRIALAAASCGIACCFTQTSGVAAVAGLAAFLLWEGRRRREGWRAVFKREACLLAAFLVVVGVAIAYFSREVGLRSFFDNTVGFAVHFYPLHRPYHTVRVYLSQFPDFLPWYRLPTLGIYLFVHLLLPLVYLLFLARYLRLARLRQEDPWERLMLLNIMGVVLFLSVVPAPAFERLCGVASPGLILLAWLLNERGKFSRMMYRTLWVVTLFLGFAVAVHTQVRWKAQLDLPRGRMAFFHQDEYDKFDWLLQRTQPSDYLFESDFPSMYYSLALLDPAKVNIVTADGYTLPEQVQDVVESLEKHRVRFVLWAEDLDMPYENRTEGDHLGPLKEYLRRHYQVVKTFSTEQVWERIEQPASSMMK